MDSHHATLSLPSSSLDARHAGRTPAVAPNMPRNAAPSSSRTDFLTDFTVFGRWSRGGNRYLMAGDDLKVPLARWMALNCPSDMSDLEMITACAKAIPNAFTEFRPAELFETSLNLPRGEVVFSVIKEPTRFSDNPPEAVQKRAVEAITQFPNCTLYELQPVFSQLSDSAAPRLLTINELRRTSGRRHQEIVDAARRLRFAFELEQRSKRLLADVAQWFETQAQLAQVRRVGAEIKRLQTKRPQMRWEQEQIRDRLWELRQELRRLSAKQAGSEVDQAVTQLDRMVSNELSRVAERLRQIESRLASLRRIDPIAVFTLPEQPHLLRFIGHWDVINGKPELHM